MTASPRWSLRVERSSLFVDDLAIDRVVLQHNARPGHMPYIHPLRIGDGRACLTEDSPWHHPHQHGIQLTFARVNGCDFWVQAGQRPNHEVGLIEPSTPRIVSTEPPAWTIETIWKHADGSHLLAGRQTWSWISTGELQLLDLDWTLLSLTDVNIEKHAYGGLFVRMPFRISVGAIAFNSAGQRDGDTEQQAATWVDLHMPLEYPYQRPDGSIDNRVIHGGIAVLDHPGNPGHPVRWRVDYQRGINPSPGSVRDIDLPAGSALRLRYRLVLHSDPLPAERIDELWAAYAQEDG